MFIFYQKFPPRISCFISIGVFDGIHLGHRYLLRKLKKEAKGNKVNSLVITFDLVPESLIYQKKFLGNIINLEQKKEIFHSLGIDYLWILKANFFLKFSAVDFLNYLDRHLKLKGIVIGDDFRFGKNKEGDISFLKKICLDKKIKLKVVKRIKIKNKIISSSLIRRLIFEAKFKEVEFFLGRCYSVIGKVVEGEGRGKLLGFPTANISFENYILPKKGVYLGYTKWEKSVYPSLIYIGRKPTFLGKKLTLETHLLNFSSSDLKNKMLEVIFLKKIAEEKKFFSQEELKKALVLYREKAKNFFKI